MSTMFDDLGSLEWGGGEEEEEEYFDEEYIPDSWMDEYDEEASAQEKRRRRAQKARQTRRRKQLRAAQRQRQRTSRQPRTPKAVVAKTRQDLKEVALETEVKSDALAGALNAVARRTGGLENGAVATPAIRLAQDRIDDFLPGLDTGAQDLVKGALEYAPTLFLKAGKKQLIGLAAGAAVLIGAEVSKRLQDNNGGGGGNAGLVSDRSPSLPEGAMLKLYATRGGTVQWSSADTTIATIDADGVVTGVKAGVTTIQVRIDQAVDFVPLTVTKAASSPGK